MVFQPIPHLDSATGQGGKLSNWELRSLTNLDAEASESAMDTYSVVGWLLNMATDEASARRDRSRATNGGGELGEEIDRYTRHPAPVQRFPLRPCNLHCSLQVSAKAD